MNVDHSVNSSEFYKAADELSKQTHGASIKKTDVEYIVFSNSSTAGNTLSYSEFKDALKNLIKVTLKR